MRFYTVDTFQKNPWKKEKIKAFIMTCLRGCRWFKFLYLVINSTCFLLDSVSINWYSIFLNCLTSILPMFFHIFSLRESLMYDDDDALAGFPYSSFISFNGPYCGSVRTITLTQWRWTLSSFGDGLKFQF